MIVKSVALYSWCLCPSEQKTSRLFLVASLMTSLFYSFFPINTVPYRYHQRKVLKKKNRDVYYFLSHSPAGNPGNCIFEPLKLKTFLGEQTPLVCSTFGGLIFRRNPCSGPPKDSKNYRKCVSKFYSTCRPRLLEIWLTLNQRLNPLNNG